MESDFAYYSRRAAQEEAAAMRAVTAAARERRLSLAEQFRARIGELKKTG